jgi:exodeoxyribonuclease-3
MKIISWNVAGLRACYNKGLVEFFDSANADAFCIQESKVLAEQNPFHPVGYKEYLFSAQKKGYSGTLIYSKIEPLSVKYGIDDAEYDGEGRVITLEYNNFYLVNVYVPNVKRDLSRMQSRMRFQDLFKDYLVNLSKTKNVVVCGDFNVAHNEIDIKNAKANIGNAGFTNEERTKMTEMLNAGFVDTFRALHPTEEKYSWWSYMFNAREKNVGWRIDYFLVNSSFMPWVKSASIDNEIFGSDHCPIELVIDD